MFRFRDEVCYHDTLHRCNFGFFHVQGIWMAYKLVWNESDAIFLVVGFSAFILGLPIFENITHVTSIRY